MICGLCLQLANLAMYHPANRERVREHGGIDALVALLGEGTALQQGTLARNVGAGARVLGDSGSGCRNTKHGGGGGSGGRVVRLSGMRFTRHARTSTRVERQVTQHMRSRNVLLRTRRTRMRFARLAR